MNVFQEAIDAVELHEKSKVKVCFQKEDDFESFVKLIKEKYNETDYSEAPKNVCFLSKAYQDYSFKEREFYSFYYDLPSEVYFHDKDELTRFAAVYTSKNAVGVDEVHSAETKEENTSASNGTPNAVKDETFPTNHAAEDTLDSVAKAIEIVFWILGAIHIIGGIFASFYFEEDGSPLMLLLFFVVGIIYMGIGTLIWAMVKVIINMSNNLYNINHKLNKE